MMRTRSDYSLIPAIERINSLSTSAMSPLIIVRRTAWPCTPGNANERQADVWRSAVARRAFFTPTWLIETPTAFSAMARRGAPSARSLAQALPAEL
jgi:hypothetical protein